MKHKFAFPVFFLLTGVFTSAPGGDVQSEATPIEVNAANDFISQHEDAVILDVRTPVEFEMSHITGAVNINVQDESFQDLVARLDPDKTYIVHCTKNPPGGRSSRALEFMRKLGFKHLYSLEGGYLAWKNAELALTETSE